MEEFTGGLVILLTINFFLICCAGFVFDVLHEKKHIKEEFAKKILTWLLRIFFLSGCVSVVIAVCLKLYGLADGNAMVFLVNGIAALILGYFSYKMFLEGRVY